MYAVVHNDERTPHLHLGLVPEFKGKLAAYQLFTPQSMRDLQDEFWEQVSRRYGLERGGEDISKVDIDTLFDNLDLENAPTLENMPKRKHKTAVELKSETWAEVKRQQENLVRVKSDVADAEHRRVEMLQILEDLQQETEKKKEDLEKAKKLIKLSEIKETEYNVTNFLLSETEKDLKEKNKKLEEMTEEKNKIFAEIDDKLTEPIKMLYRLMIISKV